MHVDRRSGTSVEASKVTIEEVTIEEVTIGICGESCHRCDIFHSSTRRIQKPAAPT